MLKFLERKRLVKKGLACNKTRRKPSQNELLDQLEHGWIARGAIFGLFAAGLAGLIFSGSQTEPAKAFLVCLLVLITAGTQLWLNHQSTWCRNSRVLLIFAVLFVHLLLLRIPLALAEGGLLHLDYAVLLLPVAFAPLMLSVLMGRSYGLFATVFASLWGAVLFGALDPVFVVVSLITGFVAVFATLQVRRRSRLIRAGFYVGIATWVLALTLGEIGPINFGFLGETDWQRVGLQSLAALGTGILTAMVVGGVLPVFESLFKITTEISWLEMADLNHPLLRRMTIEAPGTYHHSLVVASLAEAAAEGIGANATMCRVCSYFHDIGKLVKPGYFTENMDLELNPHDDLTPTMSALIIIAHVKEGVDLALKHNLNREIVDVIQQHHGTTRVNYFWKRALQQQEDAKIGGKIMNIREEDIPEVSEENFRYPGPRPRSREAAIISLADSVESASRSLEKPTPQKIEQLIEDIISDRISEHQLDACDLTLRELKIIAEKFLFTMRTMMHSRIAYPREEQEAKEEKVAGPVAARRAPKSAPPVSAA